MIYEVGSPLYQSFLTTTKKTNISGSTGAATGGVTQNRGMVNPGSVGC